MLCHRVAVGAVGRDGAARPAPRPTDGEHALALGQFRAAVADAGHDEVVLALPDLGWGRVKQEAQRNRLGARGITREGAQRVEVLGLAQPLRRRVVRGRRCLERLGIDQRHGARQPAHLGQLVIGEGCVLWAAPADDVDRLDRCGRDGGARLGHDVGLGHLVGRLGQQACHVERHVAVADHRDAFDHAEVRTGPEIRMAVQPGHEPPRAPDVRQLFAGHAELAVEHHAGGHDRGVIGRDDLVPRLVTADLQIAAEPHVGLCQQLLELAHDRLGALMVGRHTRPDQAKRRRQTVDDIDVKGGPGNRRAAQQPVGGIEARRTGPHDGYSMRRNPMSHGGPLSI